VSQARQVSRSAVGKGMSLGVVEVVGVKTWDSVPEARGVVVPDVDVEGVELAAAFLARNLARREGGSLSMSTQTRGKGQWVRGVVVRAMVGIVDRMTF